MDESHRRTTRIVVVGPCASGKSTLVSRLKAHGLDAAAIAQEHSSVKRLWARTDPDVLIALDVSLEVVRQRRSPEWLEAVYLRQHERLADAYAAADLIIDTNLHDADGVEAMVRAFLRENG